MASRIFWTLCVAVLASITIDGASAEQTATLPGGKKVLLRDDGTYKILEDKNHAEGSFVEITLADLKVDIKELSGKLVRVLGNGNYFADNLMLGDPDAPYDASPIFVKIDKLPRETRKWIISSCTPCSLVIEGEVKKDIGIFQPGIIAFNAIKN